MVELRKRKTPTNPPPPPPAKKKTPSVKAAVSKAKEVMTGGKKDSANGAAAKPAAAAATSSASKGDTISLDGFGGTITTQDGKETTLATLVKESGSGVVLFTYPKASTPGCTTQVCLFRDSYEPLSGTGFSIYGLSADSQKANTTFKTKQSLPYDLLCDPSATLISAIGLKKAGGGTTRGVFVVDKEGKVLASEPGGPAATVDVVKALVAESEGKKGDTAEKASTPAAEVAAQVADTAEKLDAPSPKL